MNRLFLISLSLLFVGPLASGQTPEASGQGSGRSSGVPATKSYVNRVEGLNDRLREVFVEFSLDYPNGWKLVRGSDPEAGYFIELTRAQPGAHVAQEYINVLQLTVDNSCVSLDDPKIRETLSGVLGQLFQNTPPSFTAAEKIDERRSTLGKYDAYELRFRSMFANEGSEPVPVWWRLALIPGVMHVNGGVRGVALIMYASGLAPEVKGIEDVGVKGGLPVVIDSFRFAPPDVSNRPEVKTLRLVEMAMGTDFKDVGRVRSLVNETSEFKSKSQIAFLWQVEGARAGMVFREVWVEDKGGRPGEGVLYEKKEVMDSNDPCGSSYKKTYGETRSPRWPTGKYRFELYADGQLLKSLPFVIKK